MYVLEMINVLRTACYELLNVQLIILGLSGEVTYYSHEKGEFLPFESYPPTPKLRIS